MKGVILVVDDEADIRRSLEGVLSDEGFSVVGVEDGQKALACLRDSHVALVLLDIWMPGIDGIETLVAIKGQYPSLPVVMISGHATIASAIKATRLGAADFLEKPIDLDRLLDTVKRVLTPVEAESDSYSRSSSENGGMTVGIGADLGKINPVVFREQRQKGRAIRQKTLAHSAVLYGQGLHSGRKSGLILEPLPPDSGIHFAGVSESNIVPAHLDFVESTGFATTLKYGSMQAGTIEHIMSTLHAYGISNLLVKCNAEVPVMDGSTLEFCSLIEETGVEEQDGEWFALKIEKEVRYGTGREFIYLQPSDGFIVDYTLEYPEPVGTQRLVFELSSPEVYRREIAPARTFGFVKDIGNLQRQGLALGGRFDNFVLFGEEESAINCELRFPDEPVRHKILDAIGDLYLFGRPIEGRVTACMTGHSDNINLLKLLAKEMNGACN